MAGTLGRRERKKLGTRQALRRAALELVAERGLERVTVEEIAEAVDVSRRTFFNHFSCKEEAVVGPDPGRLDRLREALDARPDDEPPLAVLQAVLGQVAQALAQRQDEQLLQIRVARENPALLPRQLAAFAEFERVLMQDVAARTGTDPERDVYPTLVAAAAVAALRASLAVWRTTGARPGLEDLLSAAFAQLAAGLPPPAAARRSGGAPPVRERRAVAPR